MAIDPGSKYPGNMLAANLPDWPWGEPKDTNAPGAFNGTPYKVDVVKDIMGFQQALLVNSSQSPSGTAETADSSQYYDALTTLFSRSVATTAVLRAAKHPNVDNVWTGGFDTTGDGGGAFWTATGNTGAAGTENFAAGLCYDNDGREFKIANSVINPRMYGAKGDDATDDYSFIQDAFDTIALRGGGKVYSDAGTYLCSEQLSPPDGVEWYGDSDKTKISFRGAGGVFANAACVYLAGSVADVGASLLNPIAPGDKQITFATGHNLAADDLIFAIDSRSSSYSYGNSGFKAGEYFQVAAIDSATVIDTESPAYAATNPVVTTSIDTYSVANTVMRKSTPIQFHIHDIEFIGVSATDAKPVISGNHCRSSHIERVKLSSSGAALVTMNHCFDMSFTDIEMTNLGDTGTDNNGIFVGHSQRVFFTRCRGGGSNGCIRVGALDLTDAVVNREIFVTDCHATQRSNGLGAVRFDGNCEYYQISDSQITGLQLGGNFAKISNCKIDGQKATTPSGVGEGWALYLLNMNGLQVHMSDCVLTAREDVDAATALVHWEDGFFTLFHEQEMVMSNCKLDMNGFDGQCMNLTTRTASITPSFRMSGCKVIGKSSVYGAGCFFAINTNSGWKTIKIDDCSFLELGISIRGAQATYIRRTQIERSPWWGILVANPTTNPFAVRWLFIDSCHITDSYEAGISVSDDDMLFTCVNTRSLGNNLNSTKSNDRGSLVFNPASGTGDTQLTLIGNSFGDNKSTPTQTSASYYYVNIDDVVDRGTTVFGGVAPSRSSLSDTITNFFDHATNTQESSSKVGVADGMPSAAPAGADEFVVGNGIGSNGLYIKSASAGVSSIICGDAGDADRFKFECDHNSDVVKLDIASLGTCVEFRPTGVRVPRIFMDLGSVAGSSDISLNGGWGTSPSVNGLTGGRDGALRVVIDAGTGATGVGEFTYTFPDGASGSAVPIVMLTNRGSVYGEWYVVSATSTTVVVRLNTTITPSVQYGLNMMLVWPDV